MQPESLQSYVITEWQAEALEALLRFLPITKIDLR